MILSSEMIKIGPGGSVGVIKQNALIVGDANDANSKEGCILETLHYSKVSPSFYFILIVAFLAMI